MAQTQFNKQAVDAATAERLGRELLAEVMKSKPDLSRIRELVQNGADTEIKDKNDFTPMLLAAIGRKQDAAILLLDLGAKPDANSKDGQTALLFGAIDGGGTASMPKLVRKLLDLKVDPEKNLYQGHTALMWATRRGFRDVAVDIATHGGDILRKNTGGIQQLNSIEWAEDDGKTALANELRRIQQNKEAEAAANQKRAEESATRLAEQIKKQELRVAIGEAIQHHDVVTAPEKASFRKRVAKPQDAPV